MHLSKISSGVTAALTIVITTLIAPIIRAQEAAAQPAAPDTAVAIPPPSILSVPLPPYARLRLDLDTRDDDILGVVKSYFRGFNGQSLKALLNSIGVNGTAPGSASGAAANTSGAPLLHPAFDLDKAAVLQLMSDSNLETLLRDVRHLRVVVFEMPPTRPASSGSKSTARTGTPAKPAAQSVVAYYEEKYLTREGGRRIIRGDFDGVQMLMAGFQGRGFAVVVQSPGMGVVVRADGYPNFEGAGPLAMAMMLRFAPQMSYSTLQQWSQFLGMPRPAPRP